MQTNPTQQFEQKHETRMAVALAATAALLVAVAYWPTLQWLVNKWVHNPMYSHGFLIPPLSVFLLWSSRTRIATAEKSGGKGGLLLVSAAIVIQVISAVTDVKTVNAYSFILLISAVTYFAWGRAVAGITLFPTAFLFFMIPLYDAVTDFVSLHLKLIVARLTEWLLDTTQVLAVVREGVMLHLPSGSLEVADPCSGIRSLVALSAMAALLAYLHQGKLWERLAIVLAAAPIAVAANLLRVVILCQVVEAWGAGAVETRSVHMSTGLLVYIVALGGLVSIGRLLPGGRRRQSETSQVDGAAPEGPEKTKRSDRGQTEKSSPSARYYLLLGLLATMAAANIGYRYAPRKWSELPQFQTFPKQVGEWSHVRDVAIDRSIIEILGADGLLGREYRDSENHRNQLYLMYHLNDRYGAHSPEVCYTSQGWEIEFEGARQTRRVMLPLSGLEANLFVAKKGEQRLIVLYWFFGSGGRQTPDRTRQMVANAAHRLTHTVSISGFVRVSSPIVPGAEVSAMQRAVEFADQVAIDLPSYLP